MGEVLFWSIKQCIGAELYTPDVHVAWIKVYSRMLKTMVPVAVAYEMKVGSTQSRRFIPTPMVSSGSEDSTFITKKPSAMDEQLQLNETLQTAIREGHP